MCPVPNATALTVGLALVLGANVLSPAHIGPSHTVLSSHTTPSGHSAPFGSVNLWNQKSGLSGAGGRIWFVSRSPKLKVKVSRGCPAQVSHYRDVVNTFPGPPLVPSQATAGIVCRYGSGGKRLARPTSLSQSQTAELVRVVRKLSVKRPVGIMSFHCPADFNLVVLIAFSYRGRPDVALWYHASGCQMVDNGRIGSFEGGNPSFYNGFLPLINRLSPPVKSTGSLR